jgi:cytochrome P450
VVGVGTTLQEGFEHFVIGAEPDPRPFYAELREQAPVFWSERGFFYITRYDLATTVFRDADWSVKASASNAGGHSVSSERQSVAFDVWHNTVLNMDGREHARLRRIVAKAFSPGAVRLMRGRVEEAVDAELDALAGRDEIDLVNDFALLLPTKIILDLMGISREHMPEVLAMADGIVTVHEPTLADAQIAEVDRAVGDFVKIVTAEIEDRRRSPRGDLLTALVEARDQGDSLSEQEVVSMVVALVIAGHETTGSTLPVAVHHLMSFPEQLERLRADRGIMPTAVEELLRYDAATRGSVPRFAVRDIEVGGQLIRRGDTIIVGNQAANHDPAVFSDPLVLDMTRSPNRHISFFGGSHFCLGAWLARLELQVALDRILTRYPTIELAENVRWRKSFMLRALTGLKLKVAA